MLPTPKRQEIDHRTIKLVVGVIATSLAGLTSLFAQSRIASISASYYEGGWSQSIFIGFLFAIAAFLLAYNGQSRGEMVLSKVASVAALGVALFPCKCEVHTELVPYVHGVSAAVMKASKQVWRHRPSVCRAEARAGRTMRSMAPCIT